MTEAADALEENEFALIQEIARDPGRTQREMAESVGLSLGTTNLLLKRLVRKGMLKVQQLDWKRTQYLLTWKGATEKARKTYHYTLYTYRIFRQIQENIEVALNREYAAGRRSFCLVAQDEILDLLRETITELNLSGASYSFLRRFSEVPEGVDSVLTATLEKAPKQNGFKIISLVDFDNISFRLGK